MNVPRTKRLVLVAALASVVVLLLANDAFAAHPRQRQPGTMIRHSSAVSAPRAVAVSRPRPHRGSIRMAPGILRHRPVVHRQVRRHQLQRTSSYTLRRCTRRGGVYRTLPYDRGLTFGGGGLTIVININ